MIDEKNKFEPECVLEMKNISKSFAGVKALNNVTFKVMKGQVHVLVGENGAGKSTLIKVLNGIYKADAGEIYFKGELIKDHSPKAMLDKGVATIHQELSPVYEMTIAENIFLGREPMKNGMVDFKTMNNETKALIEKLGYNYKPTTQMKELTVSDMQIVEIMKAISRKATLIIMDEPTSSITESEVAVLFKQIISLKKEGVSIIYISHKMSELFEIGDVATVLRDGNTIESKPISEWTNESLIASMVGRELTNVYPKKEATIGDTVLQVKDFNRDNVFSDINFEVKSGEILGFAGLVGAGRTEVFRAVFGLDKKTSGEVILNGKRLAIKRVSDAIDEGIAMVSEDRKGEGLVLCRSIKENMSLSNLKLFLKGGVLDKRKELETDLKLAKDLRVKMHSIDEDTGHLSGGNQQKVVLGKWMLTDAKVMIFDEPTRGIDVGAKYEIYKLMCDMAEQGVAIVMISSEMPELIGMCDRILVMADGKIQGELHREEVTQEKILTLATGENK